MAEKITDKLNELDAGSVTPQEFQEVWGISKEEYLNRMMNHVHQRKAEAAEEAAHEEEEGHDEVKGMREQMAALKKEVEQLRQDPSPGVFTFSDKEEEAMEGATEGHRPKSRRK